MKIYPNPWEQISSCVVFKGDYIKILEDKVITPDGKFGTYNILVLPGTGNGCMIIPVSPNKELYLIGLWRYPTGRHSIELPGGAVEVGETDIEAGERELLEETGLISSKWVRLGPVDTLNGYTNSVNEVLLATDVEEIKRHDRIEMKHEGINKIIKLPLNTVLRLIHDGKITHSLTIASLFLYISYAGYLKQI